MGVFDSGYEQAIIDAGNAPAAKPAVGFKEAYWATWYATRQEDLSISEQQNLAVKRQQRDELILKFTGERLSIDISDPTLPGYTTIERARLASNKRVDELAAQYSEIKTDTDLLREIKEDSRRIRERRDVADSNATFTGKLGTFSGAMAASLTDPLVAGSLFFGPSSSAGIVRTALVNAGLAATSEALIQPFVYRYKKELESPYSIGDAAERVAAAAVGAGGLSALLKGAELGVRAMRRPRIAGVDDLLDSFERNVRNPGTLERDAAFVLGDYADIARDTPFHINDPIAAERHFEATAKAISDLEANRPVDVLEFVQDLEPRPDVVKTITVKESRPAVPTENQSLSLWVKNQGGASVAEAGSLRGEYEALFEGGGSKAGAIKRKAGKSPDELAQLAHEAGFIDVPDPARLAEALADDLRGSKVYSTLGEHFERKMDLQIDREFQAWAEMAETEYLAVQDEIAARAKSILDIEDVTIAHVDGLRSARQVLQELENDVKQVNMLQKCLAGEIQ